MEQKIILSFDGSMPIPDFIKDDFEVLLNKTAEGLPHVHLIKKQRESSHNQPTDVPTQTPA